MNTLKSSGCARQQLNAHKPFTTPVCRPCGRVSLVKPAQFNSHVARVAAVEEQQATYPTPQQPVEAFQPADSIPQKPSRDLDPALAEQLEVDELDEAQEALIQWMMKDEDDQDEDLDEMVDYDEFGDEEYSEELFAEVEQMIDEFDYDFKLGDKVLGTVVAMDEDGAYIDIGAKTEAFCPLSECSFAKLKSAYEALRVGMRREFVVVEEEDSDTSQIIVSLGVLEGTVFWQRLRQMLEEQVTLKVTVESVNQGGLLVKYQGFDGFVPYTRYGSQILSHGDNLDTLVGSEIDVKLIDIDEEEEKLIFNNKGMSDASISGFAIGSVVVGKVESIKAYGAFIDISGVTGLLHISQISHIRINNINEILREGDKIKCMVLSMDTERQRLTLSTKKLEPTPGDMIKDPQLVWEKAEEMAATFKYRLEEATEMAAQIGSGLGYDPNMGVGAAAAEPQPMF